MKLRAPKVVKISPKTLSLVFCRPDLQNFGRISKKEKSIWELVVRSYRQKVLLGQGCLGKCMIFDTTFVAKFKWLQRNIISHDNYEKNQNILTSWHNPRVWLVTVLGMNLSFTFCVSWTRQERKKKKKKNRKLLLLLLHVLLFRIAGALCAIQDWQIFHSKKQITAQKYFDVKKNATPGGAYCCCASCRGCILATSKIGPKSTEKQGKNLNLGSNLHTRWLQTCLDRWVSFPR